MWVWTSHVCHLHLGPKIWDKNPSKSDTDYQIIRPAGGNCKGGRMTTKELTSRGIISAKALTCQPEPWAERFSSSADHLPLFQVFVLVWLRWVFNSIYIVVDVEWMNLYLFLINVLGLLSTNLEGKSTEESTKRIEEVVIWYFHTAPCYYKMVTSCLKHVC